MPRLFGTDGVRGLANDGLTVELALGLAQAAAVVLGKGRMADGRRASGRRPIAVVARDPRVSGEFISAAVAAGLASSGVDIYDAGVIPTPALAFLVADFRGRGGASALGDYEAEWRVIRDAGVDGVFVDHPDLGVDVFGR
jgi:phosphoglucosamine mutase